MRNRWHHGHSLGAGIMGGLLLASHVWLVIVLSLAAGFALRELYDAGRWAARTIARWANRPSAVYVPPWTQRRKAERDERRARVAAAKPGDLPESY